MNFSYADLKTALYCFATLLGIILLGIAWYVWQHAKSVQEPISYQITALILVLVGIVLILFGVETYFFRDDPDIWR